MGEVGQDTAAVEPDTAAQRCPLCGAGAFKPYRGRANARCVGCGAKERERLMALALEKIDFGDGQGPVYHFAPEHALSKALASRFGESYRAADFDPALYSWVEQGVEQVDLSRTREAFAPNSIRGFIHSHVLEHVPASVDRVVRELNEALAPGGFHAFQVPIHAGWYREDMNPDMAPEERKARFFQEDHLRVFGVEDFQSRVLDLFAGFQRLDLERALEPGALARAGVPPSALRSYTGHSVFLFVKPGKAGAPRRDGAAAEPGPSVPAPARPGQERTRITFPGPTEIEFHHPAAFHLPRYLEANGVRNYEPLTLAAFLAACERRRDGIVDIGANIGVFALSAAAALGAPVRAFEPYRPAARVLEAVGAAYDLPVHVFRRAVSDQRGTVAFYLSRRSDMSNSLKAEHRQHAGATEVQCVTLDDIARHVRLGVVKIDAETAELEILRGGRAAIERDRPHLFMELLEGAGGEEIRALLTGFGYRLTFFGDPAFADALGGARGLNVEGDLRNCLAAPEPLDPDFHARSSAWLDHLARLPN